MRDVIATIERALASDGLELSGSSGTSFISVGIYKDGHLLHQAIQKVKGAGDLSVDEVEEMAICSVFGKYMQSKGYTLAQSVEILDLHSL